MEARLIVVSYESMKRKRFRKKKRQRGKKKKAASAVNLFLGITAFFCTRTYIGLANVFHLEISLCIPERGQVVKMEINDCYPTKVHLLPRRTQRMSGSSVIRRFFFAENREAGRALTREIWNRRRWMLGEPVCHS